LAAIQAQIQVLLAGGAGGVETEEPNTGSNIKVAKPLVFTLVK